MDLKRYSRSMNGAYHWFLLVSLEAFPRTAKPPFLGDRLDPYDPREASDDSMYATLRGFTECSKQHENGTTAWTTEGSP